MTQDGSGSLGRLRGPTLNDWSDQVESASVRAAELHRRAVGTDGDGSFIREALRELDVAHDELRAAEEQLHENVQAIERAQATLEQERERYRTVFDAAPEAYLVTDPTGVVLEANQRAAELLNVESMFIVGKPLALFVEPPHRPQLRIALSEHDGAAIQQFEWRIRPRRARERFWASISLGHASTNDSSGPMRYVIFRTLPDRADDSRATLPPPPPVVDETDAMQRQAEVDAAQALHERDAFFAATAHELRSPISSIAGWLDLLGADRSDATIRSRAFASMHRSVRSLTRLVEDLVDKARVAEGLMTLEFDQVRLDKLIEGGLEEIRPAADLKSIRLITDIDGGCPAVRGDAFRLSQVVSNLIGNALKFTPVRGEITVTLKRLDADAVLSVRDNGRGIPRDGLRKIFQPYVQIRREQDSSHAGLGLGLDIARRLVDLHGGTISAESDGDNAGCVFIVRLPLAP
ncbi:MAG TPA: ATP-binding protein [Polyangiales bacterium]|nr:ATP-binding protein [Polyangiales bacterium]